VAEICQNKTADKGRIFRGFFVAQIKKCKTSESFDITWGICTRNPRLKKIFREFSRIFTVQHRNLFQDSNIPKSYLTQIRGFSWHNNEIKRIRIGYYSSNNFQDPNKRKRTKSKTMGYLPRVLFFNAFLLGAESVNQVFSKEALRSIAKVFSIRHCIAST
jgi:hypothetical protein